MSIFTSLLVAGFLCNACVGADNGSAGYWLASSSDQTVQYEQNPELRYKTQSPTGAYLSSRVARMQNDWEAASYFFDDIVDKKYDTLDIHYQAMLMALNAGRYDEAVERAYHLADKKHDNALSYVIAVMGKVIDNDQVGALEYAEIMTDDNLAKLMKEPIKVWFYASSEDEEQFNTLDLSKPFVAYQAIVATDLKNDQSRVAKVAQESKNLVELPPALQSHIAAIFKRRDIEYGQSLVLNTAQGGVRDVSDIREGLSWIFYDLAMPLYLQYQDETGRILFNMALALTPDHTEARIRVAEYAALNGRTNDAIRALRNVSPEEPSYALVQKIIAELMVEKGDIVPALGILKDLAETQKDISLYVQIGGIYAKNEMYGEAVKSYDNALKLVPKVQKNNYWQIVFARGRMFDAMGKWAKAEQDLLEALKYQPDNAFLLNYLGYSWADRNQNLDQSLEMIKKAVDLEPNDGAIRDSLGWVYYRLGYYEDATIHLEKAAALMPYDPVVNDHLGDAYWKVGRHAEAEFQWKRALSYAKETQLITQLEEKLSRY